MKTTAKVSMKIAARMAADERSAHARTVMTARAAPITKAGGQMAQTAIIRMSNPGTNLSRAPPAAADDAKVKPADQGLRQVSKPGAGRSMNSLSSFTLSTQPGQM